MTEKHTEQRVRKDFRGYGHEGNEKCETMFSQLTRYRSQALTQKLLLFEV